MEETKQSQHVLYIKAEQNVVVRKKQVLLSDLMKMHCSNKEVVNQLQNYEVFTITKDKEEKYTITILKIIEVIHKKVPDLIVINEGEADIVVEYTPEKKPKKWFEIIKTIFVGIAVFFGSAFTIMTFNEDVSVKDVIGLLSELVMGEKGKGELVLEIAYSVGLPVGIILFFNHFIRIKMDKDPTPLQVQLRLYETDENTAIIDNASREGRTIDVEYQGDKK